MIEQTNLDLPVQHLQLASGRPWRPWSWRRAVAGRRHTEKRCASGKAIMKREGNDRRGNQSAILPAAIQAGQPALAGTGCRLVKHIVIQ